MVEAAVLGGVAAGGALEGGLLVGGGVVGGVLPGVGAELPVPFPVEAVTGGLALLTAGDIDPPPQPPSKSSIAITITPAIAITAFFRNC